MRTVRISKLALALASLLALGGGTALAQVAFDSDDIGGTVNGPAGPEAGVWVIAGTNAFQTRYAKIVVTDDQGRPVPTQRLASHELAVFAADLPPLSGPRYTLSNQGESPALPPVSARDHVLENDRLLVRVDGTTGAIVELRAKGLDVNLVDTASGHGLNDYLYLIGEDTTALQRNGPVRDIPPESGI